MCFSSLFAVVATCSAGVRLVLGPEHVVVQGMRPEEHMWGPYQFPRPYNLGDRLVVSVHVSDDDIKNYGDPCRWYESRDMGVTWHETDPENAPRFGLLLPDGDRLSFPQQSAINLDSYTMTPIDYYTPGYDFDAEPQAGVLPIPDGITYWMWGSEIRAYRADRLPEPLCRSEWTAERLKAGSDEVIEEKVPVEWPSLTRVVHTQNGRSVMKALFPRGDLKIGPDGALWITAFSGEGHINPANGQYSPYYSAEIFRSEDGGRSFRQHAHMEYPADGDKYPYLSGGFSDSDIAWMPDGSMLWMFRSNWFASTGEEWSPMYWSRSTDMGLTWSKPEIFSEIGTLPRLVAMPCGTTLVCYARPGTFICASLDDSGTQWTEPLEVMTAGDRSSLANIPPQGAATFHQWAGSCNNPELLVIGNNKALIFYSDFYYPDSEGVKRKTILCRTVSVEKD